MISFEAMYPSGRGLSEYLKTHPGDRMLSYLLHLFHWITLFRIPQNHTRETAGNIEAGEASVESRFIVGIKPGFRR